MKKMHYEIGPFDSRFSRRPKKRTLCGAVCDTTKGTTDIPRVTCAMCRKRLAYKTLIKTAVLLLCTLTLSACEPLSHGGPFAPSKVTAPSQPTSGGGGVPPYVPDVPTWAE